MSDAPVLEAQDLARHYKVGRGLFKDPATLKAVDGISFSLAPGRTLGLVGESGSGKSTIARLVTMIEPPTAGSLKIVGQDVRVGGRAEKQALRKTVQMIFQDPYGSLNPRKKVGTVIAEPLTIAGTMSAAERGEAVRDMMARVGLRPEYDSRYPHMFSGGQRQRIAIARALMLRPKIVIADEPVSALDVSVQAQVLNLLMDLQDEFGLSYLFISHDLGVVRHIADEVLVMYLGRPAEHGPVREIFERPMHPYTLALLASTPQVDPAHRKKRIAVTGELPSPLDPPAGCAFHTRCPYATDKCRARPPEFRPVDGRLVACHHAETVAAG